MGIIKNLMVKKLERSMTRESNKMLKALDARKYNKFDRHLQNLGVSMALWSELTGNKNPRFH